MTRSRALAAVVIPASVILGMFACSDGTSPGRTVFGTPLTMGNGTARTYVELSSAGELSQLVEDAWHEHIEWRKSRGICVRNGFLGSESGIRGACV